MSAFKEQGKRLFAQHPGWYLLLSAACLTWVGVNAIDTVRPATAAVQGQRWVPVALVAMAMCFIPRPKMIGLASYVLFGLSLATLVFLLAPGVPRSLVPIRNGARSWVVLPGFSMQPSELAKIAFVLAMAWYLRYRSSYRTIWGLLIPFGLLFVPLGLILKQPDLGTALLFPPALIAMLIAAGAKMRHLLTLFAIGFFAVGFNVAVIAAGDKAPGWMHVLKPHQEARVRAMLDPAKYSQSEAFQQLTAMKVIGAGGLTGQGRERAALLLEHSRLPEPHNDMIFAVIVHRWGAVGGGVVVLLYVMLITSMLLVSGRSKDPFARLACVGFAGMLFAQATINIAMNVGLMPITGITLPFVSYGGSSLLSSFMMVGLTLNFAVRRPQIMARPSFEYGATRSAS